MTRQSDMAATARLSPTSAVKFAFSFFFFSLPIRRILIREVLFVHQHVMVYVRVFFSIDLSPFSHFFIFIFFLAAG